MNQISLSNQDVRDLALKVVQAIYADRGIPSKREAIPIFGVPRGGIPAAYAVAAADNLRNITVVDTPGEAHYIVDDIIDSGATLAKWSEKTGKPFISLVSKADTLNQGGVERSPFRDSWVVFPWEGNSEGSIEDNIRRTLQFIGEDPARGGLIETPHRVAKAYQEWFSGYHTSPEDVLKTFEDGAEGVDEMVVKKNIPFYSHCEHHMAAIFGTVTIAYVPNKKIVGLSKLTRLTEVFARRLQVQERLTNEIADALMTHLQPLGVGVIVNARHLCEESRGTNKQGQSFVTCALRGVLKDKPEARAEFLAFAHDC